jgi:hypothetical protein
MLKYVSSKTVLSSTYRCISNWMALIYRDLNSIPAEQTRVNDKTTFLTETLKIMW